VLVLTTFDLDEYVYEALKAGAGGFMLKDAPPRQLAEAVRTVAAGESLLAPAVTKRLIERYVSRPPTDAVRRERFAELTERELEGPQAADARNVNEPCAAPNSSICGT
jgi:DNA-binding NarL/FixJ family response regulator